MSSVIYDVAVSADGFIAGPQGDISKFATQGPVVDDYFARLKTYACAVMGRATYEFGYEHELKPGDNPYPHMRCVVFSSSLTLPSNSKMEIVRGDATEHVAALKQEINDPIYLCGGGAFAGALMRNGLIDILRLKRAPIVLGAGTKLFGDYAGGVDLKPVKSKLYDHGLVFQEFEVVNP